MSDLIAAIYGCARDVLVSDILSEDGEYFSRVRYLESERKRLVSELDESMAMKVNDLLDEKAAITELCECACFRAGLRIALELTH